MKDKKDSNSNCPNPSLEILILRDWECTCARSVLSRVRLCDWGYVFSDGDTIVHPKMKATVPSCKDCPNRLD